MAWHERQQAEALVQSYERIKQRWQGGESISASQRRFIDRLETEAAAAPGGWDLLAGARRLLESRDRAALRERNPKAIRRLKNSLLR